MEAAFVYSIAEPLIFFTLCKGPIIICRRHSPWTTRLIAGRPKTRHFNPPLWSKPRFRTLLKHALRKAWLESLTAKFVTQASLAWIAEKRRNSRPNAHSNTFLSTYLDEYALYKDLNLRPQHQHCHLTSSTSKTSANKKSRPSCLGRPYEFGNAEENYCILSKSEAGTFSISTSALSNNKSTTCSSRIRDCTWANACWLLL